MKVGIITFQNTTNYGALLQAVGLQKSVKKTGVECETIDYECENIIKREMPKGIFSEGLKRMPVVFLSRLVSMNKYKKMEAFKRKNLKLSDKKYTRENIAEANDVYDCFIAGSDIVWEMNVTGKDTSYYLDFVKDRRKKNAFSASFGYSDVPAEYIDITKKMLCDYNFISVRENEGADIVKQLNGSDVPVTLDPTLLLTGEEWRAYEKEYKITKPYVLVYFDDSEHHVLNFAKKIAKEKNLQVVYLTNSLKNVKGVKNVRSVAAEQFLYLLDKADYVVTSSYHGVVFSLNFNTEFYYYNRTHLGRIATIVSELGLEERNISTLKSCKTINWNEVNDKLNILREKSLSMLKNIAVITEKKSNE